jgi:anti-anti-sigma factor
MSEACEVEPVQVIRFPSNLDTAACAELEAELRASLAGSSEPVVFDLSHVEYVSSAFLRLCIFACRQCATQGFRIVNVNPIVKRVFKVAGLDSMLSDE